LKVYYLPFVPFHDNVTLPNVGLMFGLLRDILIREKVQICHGHQATSNMTHIALFHARTLGIPTVYTDHSLFGFDDAACIHINKVLKCMLADVQHVICVSNTNKENLILRAAIRPQDVSVIPNAVDTSRFKPASTSEPTDGRLTIVVISRMTYRKGVDLLVDIIPTICKLYPRTHWIIGGDGPKLLDLLQMVERSKLHDRVELLGRVEHSEVCHVLRRGQIFLNCSLTEAFCIALIEAASCGLAVVSTNVGGVPEVLPPSLVRLADPRADTLSDALCKAIDEIDTGRDMRTVHRAVTKMYSWDSVATRTEKVYSTVIHAPNLDLVQRVSAYMTCGSFGGFLAAIFVVIDHLLAVCFDFIIPQSSIEVMPNFQ
jgi:phosphatidylinositol glycan class A protein